MAPIKIIAFDADDTLWENQRFFDDAEREFFALMQEYGTPEEVSARLLEIETNNMEIYKYGAKPFTLSMIETAVGMSAGKVSATAIGKMLEIGKNLLNMPIVLMPGVLYALQQLRGKFGLVIATKGDLSDQRRKVERSGISGYFDHIEIMSDKTGADYAALIDRLHIRPEEFLMVGNSLKSDILPVLSQGGRAVHIPCEATWAHERVDLAHPVCETISSMEELPSRLLP